MWDTMDPITGASNYSFIFFIIFIILVWFVTLNLFIAIIVDNFSTSTAAVIVEHVQDDSNFVVFVIWFLFVVVFF